MNRLTKADESHRQTVYSYYTYLHRFEHCVYFLLTFAFVCDIIKIQNSKYMRFCVLIQVTLRYILNV